MRMTEVYIGAGLTKLWEKNNFGVQKCNVAAQAHVSTCLIRP